MQSAWSCCKTVFPRNYLRIRQINFLRRSSIIVFSGCRDSGWTWRSMEKWKLQLTLDTCINREKIGQLQTGSDLLFSFPSLIASLCADRAIHAGTILSTGTVSNADAKKDLRASLKNVCMSRVRHFLQLIFWNLVIRSKLTSPINIVNRFWLQLNKVWSNMTGINSWIISCFFRSVIN